MSNLNDIWKNQGPPDKFCMSNLFGTKQNQIKLLKYLNKMQIELWSLDSDYPKSFEFLTLMPPRR